VVGNIRRCRKHVRAIDLSPPWPQCPRPPLPFSTRVPVAFGTPDFSVATERGVPATKRSMNSQERERASEQARVDGRAFRGVGRQRGATVGGGYPTRYLNLRLPRGRAQKCKAIVSRPRPVSSSAGSLLYLPERGNVSRYTRKHRGVGYLSAVRCRCCCLVSSSIYSTGTHDLRNSRRSPLSCFSLSLSLSLSISVLLLVVYMSTLFIPSIFNDLLLLPAKRISRRRGFTAREIRTTIVRLRRYFR